MFVFFLFVVVERLLCTTSCLGLLCLLCFVVGVCFGLRSGCASCHKQWAKLTSKEKGVSLESLHEPKNPHKLYSTANFDLRFSG